MNNATSSSPIINPLLEIIDSNVEINIEQLIATINADNDNSDTEETPTNSNGETKGDPHLITFDRLEYDFHAAGEFTLVESTEDDFQVQVRAEHINNGATFNTAAATEVDGRRVAIYADPKAPLLINDNVTELDAGESLALGDGSITRKGNTYTVNYSSDNDNNSDSEQLTVALKEHKIIDDFYFLNVETVLSNEREGTVVGLLGNNNGIAGDDLALQDGTVLDTPVNFNDFYTDFADGWRISDEESLFDYGEGEATSTFTETNFFENNNFIAGLEVTEYISAGAGNDVIIGSDSADVLDGEEGRDTIFYRDSKVGVILDLSRNIAFKGQAEGDLIFNFENAYGSKFNDSLTGDEQNNIFDGRGGRDILTGGEGKDFFNYKTLRNSVLSDFDSITDLEIGTDVILGVKPVDAGEVMPLCTVEALDEASIQAMLGESEFVSYGAAVFTYESQIFLALNDEVAGYSASDDAIIEITGMTGSIDDLAIL